MTTQMIEQDKIELNGWTSEHGISTSDNWRERAILASLEASVHYAEGEYELFRQIRMARPDAVTLVIDVDRGSLLEFLERRAGPVRALAVPSRRAADIGAPTFCAGWYGAVWEGRAVEIAFTPATYEKGGEVCIGSDYESLVRLSNEIELATIRPAGRCLRFTASWEKAPDLDAEVGKVTWEDVVLPQDIERQIRESVTGFFEHKQVYRTLGFGWRRGLLLVGPPGTGKTMICKAIAASQPHLPFLYVRDVRDRTNAPGDAVKTIFGRARKLAPCILAFEDIDGLVGDARRTVFLNELDGFKDNDGLFVVASSNHPAKIDEALLKRPSRFDRVFHIGLPEANERRRFCLRILERPEFAARADRDMNIEDLAERIAKQSEGFTPAYLKEALVSAALARAQEGSSTLDVAYGEEVLRQVDQLGDYMRRAKNPDAWAQMRSARDAVGFRS